MAASVDRSRAHATLATLDDEFSERAGHVRIREIERPGDDSGPYTRLGGRIRLKENGYRSVHYVIRDRERGIPCEIQIRSIFDEGWSAIDHRLRYSRLSCPDVLSARLQDLQAVSGEADDLASTLRTGVR